MAIVELRFELTEKEVVRAARQYTLQHPFTRVLGVFSVLPVAIAFLANSTGGAWLGLLVGGVCWLYILYQLLVVPGRSYEKLRSLVGDCPLFYRFTSTGAEVKAEKFQARWVWSMFRHFTENKDCFAIYPKDSGSYVLLPKRAFDPPASVDDLREILRSKLRAW